MIKIEIVKKENATVLALLGRITYAESHKHYISDKKDLKNFLDEAYSINKTLHDLNNPQNLFYLIYIEDLPVGYAKLVLNEKHKSITSDNICRLERIYILNEFIPLKLGQRLLSFVEEESKTLQLDTIWLSVYIKNTRAIRFYEKNEFKKVGNLNFMVNDKDYENIVYSKTL